MTNCVCGSIHLQKGRGSTAKGFALDVLVPLGLFTTRTIAASSGPVGNLGNIKNLGNYTQEAMKSKLERLIKNGYEVSRVNGKPFPSGDISDAILVIENNGDWNEVKTAQPDRKIVARQVEVTFDVGQVAPIW